MIVRNPIHNATAPISGCIYKNIVYIQIDIYTLAMGSQVALRRADQWLKRGDKDMVDVEKLGNWVQNNPEAADEDFMNVTTQRKITIRDIYEELKKEKETGVAIVDPEITNVLRDLDDWLEEQ